MKNRYNWSDGSHCVYDEETKKILSLQEISELLNTQSERIRSLEEQLKNAIVPKFKIGQEVCIIDDWDDTIEENTIEKIAITKENVIYYLRRYSNYFRETELFATQEEAEKQLAELRGEGK